MNSTIHDLTESDRLLAELFKARSAAKAERARFVAAVRARGGWRCVPDIFAEDYDPEKSPRKCWRRDDGYQCPDCKIIQPYHTAWKSAQAKAAGALRKAVSAGYRIFMSSTDH